MADNVNITPGTGKTIAADEVSDGTLGTVSVQYVKIMDGTLDGTTKAAVGSNGLKIDGSAVTQPVSASSLPLPTGAATAANQTTANSSLSSIAANTGNGLTDTQLRANPVPISGTVTATVTGIATAANQTNASQKTQVVDGSGNVIGATSNALDINIKSGNISGFATAIKQPALGTAGTASTDVLTVQGIASMTALKTDSSATTQPVSGTFWQTTQPISGSITNTYADTSPATANITAVDASSTSSTANQNNQTFITGTPTTNSAATFALTGQQAVRFLVTGTWVGSLATEYSIDGGTTWHILLLHQNSVYNISTGITANFTGNAQTTGMTHVRVRCTAYTSGTATVKVVESTVPAIVSVNNSLPSGNLVSLLNSSTVTLTAGSTFTGGAEDIREYGAIVVSVQASHASATDGLSIQQSYDGITWFASPDTYTVAATVWKTFAIPRQARYYRVVYTNGGTNQTSFILQTILNRMPIGASSQRTQDSYSNENDMEQVWALNSGWNPNTLLWDRLRSDQTGLYVKQVASSATLSNVAGSASSVTLLAANTARIGAQITNDSSALLYIKFGATASTSSYTVVLAGAASAPFSYYEVPAGYAGRIDGIWSSANGNARVTEES